MNARTFASISNTFDCVTMFTFRNFQTTSMEVWNYREDANLWILFFKGSFLRLAVLYKFFYTHHLPVIQKNSVVCCYYCLPEASANMSTDNRRILIRCAHLKQPKTKLLWLDTKSTRNRLRKYQKDQPRSVVVIV